MSVSKGFWSQLVSGLRSLLRLPDEVRSEPAKMPVETAVLPLTIARPVPSFPAAPVAKPVAAADAAATPAAVEPGHAEPARKSRKFELAGRLAVTSRLNRQKGAKSRKSSGAARKAHNRPVTAVAAAPKRSAKRPVWIGAEIRNRVAKSRTGNVVPFRGKPGSKLAAARPQAQPTRRAA